MEGNGSAATRWDSVNALTAAGLFGRRAQDESFAADRAGGTVCCPTTVPPHVAPETLWANERDGTNGACPNGSLSLAGGETVRGELAVERRSADAEQPRGLAAIAARAA